MSKALDSSNTIASISVTPASAKRATSPITKTIVAVKTPVTEVKHPVTKAPEVKPPVTKATVAVKAPEVKAPEVKEAKVKPPAHSEGSHNLVRLGLELGLAVNDYNSGFTDTLDEVDKLTLAYLAAVKLALKDKIIASKEIRNYFALVGQSWGSIMARFDNEYLEELYD